MNKYLVITCFLLLSGMSEGQKLWTLGECINYALENNIDIKQQEIIVKKTEIELFAAQNNRLPSLNAGTAQSFNFGHSQSQETGIYENVQTSSTSISASSSMALFSGFGLTNNIRMGRLNLLASLEGLKKAKDNLEIQIAYLYLDVLLKKEILKVYQFQFNVMVKQVERTVILVESGKVPQSQLLDIKAQIANNEVSMTNAANDLVMSLLNLSQTLNLQNKDFDIVLYEFENEITVGLVPAEVIFKEVVASRAQVKEAQYRLESSQKGVKIAQASMWPSLSLGLSYASGFSHIIENIDGVSFSETEPWLQLKNNQRQAIGLNLSFPLFNKNQVRNQIKSARLTSESNMLELDKVKMQLFKEIQQVCQGIVTANIKYAATGKAVQAFVEAFIYVRERYEVGKSTVYELSDAQAKLINVKSEQLQAKYELLFRTKILDFYRGKAMDF